MASSKEYAYYIKGNSVAVVEKDWSFSSGQTLSQPALSDIGPVGALLWKSPTETIADGLEIQYVHSPEYILESNASLDVLKYKSDGAGILVLSGGTNYDSRLDVDDYFLLRNCGKFNGVHKVKSFSTTLTSNDTITTYTQYDNGSTALALFEETGKLYYDVNFLNDEDDILPLPDYLCKAVVYYVKAKYAEDAGEIDMKEYFMREFRRFTEKFQTGRQKGPRIIQGFPQLT
jgi:hypothetical protein